MSMLSDRKTQSAKSNYENDELYSFDKNTSTKTDSGRVTTSYGVPRTSRLNTASLNDGRPMTSVRAAGYSSRGRSAGTSSSPMDVIASSPLSTEKLVISPEDQIKVMEKSVHSLIYESCKASESGDHRMALEKAKEAGKKERLIAKQKEQTNLTEQVNLDLTYCVLFNLGNHYYLNKMYQEALNTFAVIVKNKAFTQSGRLRVNMGNIFFDQQNYSQAIKMYRMALDQIPSSNKETKLRIMRNIGISFIKMGQYQDAASSFESIMETRPDYSSAFNLVLCYYALGDKERMKKGFQRVLNIKPYSYDKNEDFVAESLSDEPIHDHQVFNQDALRSLSREKKKSAERFILMSAKLIAPAIESTFSDGYDWIVDTIKATSHADIASELEISKSIEYLKKKEFSHAIETLKSFEKKDKKLVGTASTNLSFLYFLEGDDLQTEHYANVAMEHDRYNSKAQTNKGNVYFKRGELEKAKECYQGAISIDAVCTEAMYNLGLVYKSLGNFPLALEWFEKLHSILSNSAQVIYQIADIHEQSQNMPMAFEWYNVLVSVVPTDPGILAKLGNLFEKNGEKAQAFQYYSESFRYYPSNLNVIAWLGAYYVECELYEQAIQYFERAVLIQPMQVKWRLMIASCHRRSGNYQNALDLYKKIHDKFPDNLECLRFLVRICTDLGIPAAAEYASKLSKTESRDGGYKEDALTDNTNQVQRITQKTKTLIVQEDEKEDWHHDVTSLLPE